MQTTACKLMHVSAVYYQMSVMKSEGKFNQFPILMPEVVLLQTNIYTDNLSPVTASIFPLHQISFLGAVVKIN